LIQDKDLRLHPDYISSTSTQRRYDIDWLRTIALGLLIMYHIVISFQPWAKAIYFIQNDDSLEWLWIPMSMLNVWRIPLLFMVSGMGVRFAMERRNLKQIILDRTLRIVVPLVFGIFAICPIAAYFVRDYYDLGGGYIPNAGHLWFLINIICYLLYFLYIVYYFTTEPDNRFLRFVSRALNRVPWLLFAAAIPLSLEALIANPEYYALFPTPHGHFVGMICFGLGLLFVSLKDAFWNAVRRVKLVAVAAAFLIYLVRLLVFQFEGIPKYLVGLESMFWMLGILGYGAAILNKPSRALSYLSKSVYPVYIIHMPIQYAISYYLIPMTLPASLKLGILLLGTFGACFVLYEVFIRQIKWIRPLFGVKFNQV